MRRALPPLLVLICAACASPLDVGERQYRDGDLRGALETWQDVAADSGVHAAVQERVGEVEPKFERLIVAYKRSAKALEADQRLAESLLDYRLALELQPSDTHTLDHVQRLARKLQARKAELTGSYERVRDRGDLEKAQQALQRLRRLDPFDPEYETEARQLDAKIRADSRRRRAVIRSELIGEVAALIEAGRSAFADERLETALQLWRIAELVDPKNERLQAYIARAEGQLEQLEELRDKPTANGAPERASP